MADQPDITEHVEVLRQWIEHVDGRTIVAYGVPTTAIRAIVAAYPKPITFTDEEAGRFYEAMFPNSAMAVDPGRDCLAELVIAGMVEIDGQGRKVIVL